MIAVGVDIKSGLLGRFQGRVWVGQVSEGQRCLLGCERLPDSDLDVRAGPMVKTGNDRGFLSIRGRPMRVATRFMARIPVWRGFMTGRTGWMED